MNVRRSLARFVSRSYPFWTIHRRFLTFAERLIPKPGVGEEATAVLQDGSRMFVKLDDFDGQFCYYNGVPDLRIGWICRRVLRPGDCVVDVGANYGSISLIAARRVGPSGRVHAFEPQPKLREMFERSKLANGLSQIQIHSVALSETNGTKDFYVAEDHTGGSSFSRPDGQQIRKVTVEIRRASDYLADFRLSPFRLMKVDVEGHEAQVFEGSKELFEKNPPNVVIFESTDRAFRDRYVEEASPQVDLPFAQLPTVQFLRSFDYELFAVSHSYLKVRLPKVDLTVPAHPNCSDVLAVHKSVLRDLARPLDLAV